MHWMGRYARRHGGLVSPGEWILSSEFEPAVSHAPCFPSGYHYGAVYKGINAIDTLIVQSKRQGVSSGVETLINRSDIFT
jgi:hypothetical protein